MTHSFTPSFTKSTSFAKTVRLAAVALAATALITGSAFAGAGHGKKCQGKTQECLDKMASKLRTKGWLGIETAKTDSGWYKISAVQAGSPAATAGLQVGDVLLALNGVKIHADNKAELKQAKKALLAGSAVNYVVKRDGTKQQVAVTLGNVPDIQIAEWIGQHLLEHHATERMAAVH